MNRFLHQGHAEDVILRHRYCYYVLGRPELEDWEYDELERGCKLRWSVGVWETVGSSNPKDYPEYVIEGRRPDELERIIRDRVITERWMREL